MHNVLIYNYSKIVMKANTKCCLSSAKELLFLVTNAQQLKNETNLSE